MGKKVVRVFIDSDVILSGLLSDRGAPRILLDLLSLELPFLTGSTGRYNLIEIERNLKKKIPKLLPIFKDYFSKLHLDIIPIPRSEELKRFHGEIAEKDLPVLLSAINSKADFLITGDKHHFGKLKGFKKYTVQVVTPSEFIDSILPEIIKKFGKEE